jgi:hypothetical protein
MEVKNMCRKIAMWQTRHEVEIYLLTHRDQSIASNLVIQWCPEHDAFHVGHDFSPRRAKVSYNAHEIISQHSYHKFWWRDEHQPPNVA